MSDGYLETGRRNVLKQLGLVSVGSSGLLAATDEAAARRSLMPPQNKVDEIWNAMVDMASDLLGSSIPLGGVRKSDLSVQEKQHRFRSLLDKSVSTDGSVYIPGDLPFSACYWTDYGLDGKKICIKTSPAQYGHPDCWQSTPPLGYVTFNVTSFDLKWDRSWKVRKEFSFWGGLTSDGCPWTGQQDTELRSEVIRADDVLDWASETVALAEAGLRARIEAVQEWASKIWPTGFSTPSRSSSVLRLYSYCGISDQWSYLPWH